MEYGPRDTESLSEHTKRVHSTKGGKVGCPGDSVTDWVCAGGGRRTCKEGSMRVAGFSFGKCDSVQHEQRAALLQRSPSLFLPRDQRH